MFAYPQGIAEKIPALGSAGGHSPVNTIYFLPPMGGKFPLKEKFGIIPPFRCLKK